METTVSTASPLPPLNLRSGHAPSRFRPDSVFVLVVPAINHIYADPAYGLVTSKNKAASTILVLSKIDDAAKNDVVWHNTVVPRLLGEDEELTAHSFKCVIGTKCRQQNRQNCDEIRIEDADESELAWASHKIMDTDVSAAKRVALHGHLTVCGKRVTLSRCGGFRHPDAHNDVPVVGFLASCSDE